MAVLAQVPGLTRARLGAQILAQGFHERLGFTLAGPVYTDAGIPHGDMVLALPPGRGGPDGGPPRRG